MNRTLQWLSVMLVALGVLWAPYVEAAPPEDPPPAPARRPTGPPAYFPRGAQARQARYDGPSQDRVRQAAIYQPDPGAPIEEIGRPPAGANYRGSVDESESEVNGPYSSFDYGTDGDYGGCNDCGSCGYPCHGPLYARGEYLLWWVKGDNLPPLVTTSPTGTSQIQAGVLGQPNTTILFGNDRVNDTARSGARVVIGKWLDPSNRIEGEWFGLAQKNTGFSETSQGDPILARPFFNLTSGAPDAHLIAYPNFVSGTVSAQTSSNFLGAGLFGTHMLCFKDYCGDRHWRLDFVYGFRYLRLSESLSINDTVTSTATVAPTGSTLTAADSFGTINNFYGGTIGLMTESRACRWSFTSIGRLSLGGTSEQVNIAGNSSATTPNGGTTNFAGGLLALPTNIGTYNHNGFTVVPELQLKLAYDLTSCLRFTFGYDVMYWSRVARPGEQVDLAVNTSQASGGTLKGTPGPLFSFRETDLWVQGISAGGELRF